MQICLVLDGQHIKSDHVAYLVQRKWLECEKRAWSTYRNTVPQCRCSTLPTRTSFIIWMSASVAAAHSSRVCSLALLSKLVALHHMSPFAFLPICFQECDDGVLLCGELPSSLISLMSYKMRALLGFHTSFLRLSFQWKTVRCSDITTRH